MHSFHHSRGRIFFEVLCAFGIAASCVWAWQQTYATAMLPAAGIAGLYGLVHFFDMFRRRLAAAEPVVVQPAADQSEPAPMIEAPVFAEPPVEAVVEPAPKRKRKSSRQAPKVAPVEMVPESEVVEAVEPEPDVVEAVEPEVVELQPTMRVVDNVPDEPEYVPATPLFEAEPFVRQQRAAFGRKAR